jgi:hypothetical protein
VGAEHPLAAYPNRDRERILEDSQRLMKAGDRRRERPTGMFVRKD